MAYPIGIALKAGGFLKRYWKEIALVLALVGAILYWRGLLSEIEYWQDRYISLEKSSAASAQLCKDNRITLENGIDLQNGKITSLNKLLEEKGLLIDKYQLDAFNTAAKHKKELNDIKNEEPPKTCEKSIEYLIKSTGELQWSE